VGNRGSPDALAVIVDGSGQYPAVTAIEIDPTRGWQLAADASDPSVALAAAELTSGLGPPGEEGIEIALSHANGTGDGFRRHASPARIEVRGESSRGLLFGVYRTLEELGLTWPWPGRRHGESRSAQLEERVEDAPALPGRCLVLGERALLEDVESWIVWAARAQLNTVFVHVSTGTAPTGAAPEALWLECRDRALELARERGMTIEHGGHLLPELLSPSELSALAAGEPPSDETRHTLARYVRAHAEAEVLHLWGADLPPGASGEASEATLRTANAVAELAEAERPGAQVAYLAYHETERVPRAVRPRSNVCLVFAPRERCYEHSLADRSCRRNARYRDLLLAQLEHFGAYGAAPPRVFEYWFDAILFAGGVPDLSETMAEDLRFYAETGVHTVQLLATGHGGSPAPHPNPPAFARLAWDPTIGVGSRI
jgi:Domain of unknown function (DUF4838)